MISAQTCGRRRPGRLLPFLLCLVLAACAGDAVDTTTTSTIPATTTMRRPVVDMDATTTTSQRPTTTTAVNAADELTKRLDAASDNYRFVSTVTVDSDEVTRISGVVDGPSVSATIASGSSEVSYVRTAEGEWITDAGGDWVEVDGDAPVDPPLESLRDPESLEVASAEGSTVVLEGTLGKSAGAASGVAFTLEIVDEEISTVRYEAETSGQVAVVTTSLSEIGSAGDVSRPEGS